jgi:hypothetical protein
MLKHVLSALLLTGLIAHSSNTEAQQSQDFGDYVVHYNALNTNLIPPQVATAYGIKRSSSRVLLNVTILKKVMGAPGTPVQAEVVASATNLTGQRRDLEIREIKDSEGAVYYLGELPVHNMETFNFVVEATPSGENQPLTVKFLQQFYTE